MNKSQFLLSILGFFRIVNAANHELFVVSELPPALYRARLEQERKNEANMRGILLLNSVKANNIDEIKKLLMSYQDINIDIIDPSVGVNFFSDITAILKEMKNAFKNESLDELPKGPRAIHYACKNNNNEIVKLLLAASAQVNVYNYKNLTPLHLASLDGNLSIMSDLLNAKADINACTNANMTSLHFATVQKNFDSVKLLLNANADPNIQQKNLSTALHTASYYRKENIIALLLQRDAKTHLENYAKLTAAQMAKESKHDKIIEVFTKHYTNLIFEKINKFNLLPRPLALIISQYATDLDMSTEPEKEEFEMSYLEMLMHILESV